MAAQGTTALQQKVSKLLSRQHGRPVLKPNKPLVLKDEVASRKMRRGEASCITEISLLMACWKKSDFNDALCSSEVKTFYECIAKAQAEMKIKAAQQASGQGGRLLPRQATSLLKRHPNIRKEI
ncbi:small ribosomal subunit protein mS37 [Denticeps clupeoides]|uniref:Coiled-coil-helix-coiled-coil-helix domain-containing protein 1 n=1 Tax=Denticeps clupeoides TaxID=299321 RepID=A0AAY4D6N7_9TELE|nr:coiled-coil-helix-coiled-coil-helix domain-containing protein 1 [Denticeps clupeoides]